MRECSQKLELLRVSLEKCLKENNQESLQPPAGRSEEPPSPHSSTPKCPLSTSPSLLSIRPASLTGVQSFTVVLCVCGWKKRKEGWLVALEMSTKQILKYILRKWAGSLVSWGLSTVHRRLTSGGWIIRTCNLPLLDSFGYKLSLPTRCKRKLWGGKSLWWCNEEANPGVAPLAANNENRSHDGAFLLGSRYRSSRVRKTRSEILQAAVIEAFSPTDLFMPTNERL